MKVSKLQETKNELLLNIINFKLHKGNKSESQSESLCNWRSVIQSVSQSILAMSPSGTHDQILAVVKMDAALFVVGHLPW